MHWDLHIIALISFILVGRFHVGTSDEDMFSRVGDQSSGYPPTPTGMNLLGGTDSPAQLLSRIIQS
jgi:hypothetical protein